MVRVAVMETLSGVVPSRLRIQSIPNDPCCGYVVSQFKRGDIGTLLYYCDDNDWHAVITTAGELYLYDTEVSVDDSQRRREEEPYIDDLVEKHPKISDLIRRAASDFCADEIKVRVYGGSYYHVYVSPRVDVTDAMLRNWVNMPGIESVFYEDDKTFRLRYKHTERAKKESEVKRCKPVKKHVRINRPPRVKTMTVRSIS